ncbi:PLDc N-terminal domain-containing protein [Glutamicibacter sp. NPDC087344]|uniref:PLDc N-terminal domain-containing protein n=1 Tax=Glutamicibacter sp. NPDC087344 TaxID=3363994 RepID=UPI00382E9FA6
MARSKKKFSQLSPVARTAAIVAGTLEVLLFAAAQIDIYRRKPEQINGSKGLWVGLCFINFLGPLSYFSFGRKKPQD